MAAKRRMRKRILLTVLFSAAVLFAALGILRLRASQAEAERKKAEQSIAEAAVTRRSVRTTVMGNGILAEEDAGEIRIPKGIKAAEVLVEGGDRVAAGDVLATVDADSVRDAITDVQSQIDSVDRKLLELKEEMEDEPVKAPIKGRVDRLYVENGSDAASVMSEQGALLTLIPDGDTREIRITAPRGEVRRLNVSAGSPVEQGDRLFTLRRVKDDAERTLLLTERQELSGVLSALYRLSADNRITASRAGIIKEVYLTEGETVSGKPASGAVQTDVASALTGNPLYTSFMGGTGLMSTHAFKESLSMRAFSFFAPGAVPGESPAGSGEKDAAAEAADAAAEEPGVEGLPDASAAFSAEASSPGTPEEASASAASGTAAETAGENGATGAMDDDIAPDEGNALGIDPASQEPDVSFVEAETGFEPDPEGSDVEEGEELPADGGTDSETVLLTGSFFIPIRVPEAGASPMRLEETEPYLRGALYTVSALDWSIGADETFAPGGHYTVRAAIRTDTAQGYYITPDSGQVGINVLGSSGYTYTIEDLDGDGLYEQLSAEIAYDVPPAADDGAIEAEPAAGEETSAGESGQAGGSIPITIGLPDGTTRTVTLPGSLTLPEGLTLPDSEQLRDLIQKGVPLPEGYSLPAGSTLLDLLSLPGLSGKTESGSTSPLDGAGVTVTLPNGISFRLGTGDSASADGTGGTGTLDLAKLLGLDGKNGLDLAKLLGLDGKNGLDLAKLLGLDGNNGLDLAKLLGLGSTGSLDLSKLRGASDTASLLGLGGLSALPEGTLPSYLLTGSSSGTASALLGTSPAISTYADAVVFSTVGSDKMKVSISVNEMDILQIREGQTAEVTLDAIGQEVFTGVVTKIAGTGSNSGGTTKYAVEIELTRDPRMRPDMSCTVSILISEKDDVRVVPAAAIFSDKGKSYVYTVKDDQARLTAPVEITTGISDGEYVEVLSGLTEGQTVYYRNKTVNYLEMMNQAMGRQENTESSSRASM